ncbi:MAG: CocE/NonD family hydrolase [Ignavibacteriae bacterium]|nr:CocE/NonD family hydrolase [Ignavibacteriota bacterium]
MRHVSISVCDCRCIIVLIALAVSLPLAHAPAQARFPYAPRDIPVRDGKTLAADLYSTDTTVPKPVILIQTPYNKAFYRLGLQSRGGGAFPYDTAKYHYVILDWRGFYGSKDADVRGYDRGLDGYDAVEWIAAQRWSNGKVGTWGLSALGHIQFLTAKHHPPHLVCAVPCVKDFKTKYSDYFYGGVYRKEHVESLESLGFLTTSAITSQPTYNAIWRAVENNSDLSADIAVPMLLIGGWFDHFPDDVIRAFHDLADRSDAKVRDAHKILYGPWTHGDLGIEQQGELSFPNAVSEPRDIALQFFGYYLWQEKNAYPLRPPFMYYQMGDNVWRDYGRDSTAVPGSSLTFWLHADGSLLQSMPADPSATRTLIYDPRNPSPSHGGARFNPLDQTAVPGPLDIRAAVESRPDALVFSTPPLGRPLTLDGPITATLLVSSDRTDTDMSVRFCDVYPDGRSMILADGILRGRYRKGVDRQVPLVPGVPDTFRVELQKLAVTLLPGHRMRIVVSSSNFPRFDINLNNGGPMYTAGDTLVATNTVHMNTTLRSTVTIHGSDVMAAGGVPAPEVLHIGAPYPNPVCVQTVFPIAIPGGSASVTARVLDVLGRQHVLLYDGPASATPAQLHVNTTGLPAGTYLLHVTTGKVTTMRRFSVVK